MMCILAYAWVGCICLRRVHTCVCLRRVHTWLMYVLEQDTYFCMLQQVRILCAQSDVRNYLLEQCTYFVCLSDVRSYMLEPDTYFCILEQRMYFVCLNDVCMLEHRLWSLCYIRSLDDIHKWVFSRMSGWLQQAVCILYAWMTYICLKSVHSRYATYVCVQLLLAMNLIP